MISDLIQSHFWASPCIYKYVSRRFLHSLITHSRSWDLETQHRMNKKKTTRRHRFTICSLDLRTLRLVNLFLRRFPHKKRNKKKIWMRITTTNEVPFWFKVSGTEIIYAKHSLLKNRFNRPLFTQFTTVRPLHKPQLSPRSWQPCCVPIQHSPHYCYGLVPVKITSSLDKQRGKIIRSNHRVCMCAVNSIN